MSRSSGNCFKGHRKVLKMGLQSANMSIQENKKDQVFIIPQHSQCGFFSCILVVTSMILSFSKYGVPTIGLIWFCWPFGQLKPITLSKRSHISFIGINNGKIRKCIYSHTQEEENENHDR